MRRWPSGLERRARGTGDRLVRLSRAWLWECVQRPRPPAPALEGLEERRAVEAEGGYEPSIQGDPTTHSGASQDQTQNPLRWRPANSNTEALPRGVADHDGAVDARLSSSTA
jgi:hypothetical protein